VPEKITRVTLPLASGNGRVRSTEEGGTVAVTVPIVGGHQMVAFQY
jgi:hypothetical protein